MSRVGGLTHKYYKETKGIKVAGGQKVKAGTILTRQGEKWKRGVNVVGVSHLTAVVDGEVYFTRKKNNYNKIVTVVNVKPVAAKSRAKAKKSA